MTGPTGPVGPTGSTGQAGPTGQSVLFSYSTAKLPVASFDISDRLSIPNTLFTKTIPQNTVISDSYGKYYAKTNGYNTYSTRYTFGINPTNKWLAGGIGTNTMAFSNDGVKWYPMGSTVFTTQCNALLWNGFLWVAGGAGTNTLAYSYDSVSWTGLGTSIFDTQCTSIVWNGTIFVATGYNTNHLAYSYDGINWTGLGTTLFTGGGVAHCVSWNGQYFLAGGSGTTNRIVISTNGINWNGLDGSSVFGTSCRAIIWTGAVWVGGGRTTGSLGVLAYSLNNGTTWTAVTCPVTSLVTGLAVNQQTIVATGCVTTGGVGNTVAYSSDIYGTSWTGIGTTLFNNNNVTPTFTSSVKWANNKFILFSQDLSGSATGNRIAYSLDGKVWKAVANANTIFSTCAICGECSTVLPHTITFPSNYTVTGNIVSRDNGLSWGFTPLTSPANAIGWNGTNYLFGGKVGKPSYLTYDISGSYVPLSYGSDPSGINIVRWNGGQWLIGGLSTTTRHILSSQDGWNWIPSNISSFVQANYPCNGISWNGKIWVVSGLTSVGSYLLYGSDGLNWTLASSTFGGGPVEWNGSYFLAGGPISGTTTNVSRSNNGIIWSSLTIGNYGVIQSLAYNGTIWVATTNSTTTAGILNSYDGITWNAVGGTQTYSHLGVQWNGLTFVVNTNFSVIRYSYDGTTWSSVSIASQNGNGVLWAPPNIGTMDIQQPTIVGGSNANNTMAYSIDGVYYKALGNGIFSVVCNAVIWNGKLWVAGGQGTNTLAYSYNGLTWNGLGSSVFTSSCYSIAWNNTVFVACGAGGNTLATSTDGLTWTGQGTTIFDLSGQSADWNGTVWMAVGNGTTNTMAYSSNANGTGWTGMGKTTFTTAGNSIKWMLNKWVAAGSGTNKLAYSTSTSGNVGWTISASNVFSTAGNALYWNGSIAIAGGTGTGNTLATSSDGISWTGIGVTTFSTACYGLYWNTIRWVGVGTGGNTIAYSYNGTTWYPGINTSILTTGYAVGSNSRMGVTTVNSGLYMTTNDTLTINSPPYYDESLCSDTAISINMDLP
jgi:hypothetical protein